MKKRTYQFITLFIFSTMAAQASSPCRKVKNLQLSLSVHGSNVANEKTTRTAEGGAYQKLELDGCQNGCKIKKSERFILKYEPDHPDANVNGYVSYPDIKVSHEINKFVAAMNELEVMAKAKKCGLSLGKARKGIIIQYREGIVEEDQFILPDHNLISGWKRKLKAGGDSLLSFSDY